MKNECFHLDSADKESIFLEDLQYIFDECKDLFEDIRNGSIFLTGGTGFIGIWMLEALFFSNKNSNLNINVTVLTRDVEKFREKCHRPIEDYGFNFIQGDVTSFIYPEGNFTHVIHAATDASAYLNENHPDVMYRTIVMGTNRVLDFSVEKKVRKFLFLSSGAIYGQQPWEMTHISEDWSGSLNCLDARNTYAEAKRSAEMLCAIYAKKHELNFTSARIFSTFGPFLPLDTHFAIGNFIKNSIEKKTITINGNGLPHRSGLYISETIIWLFYTLISGHASVAYNIGSDESFSIEEIAKKVSGTLGGNDVVVLGKKDSGWNLGRYVPSVVRIKKELNVEQKIGFEEAVIRTAIWNGWKK